MDATASRSPNRRYSKLHFILESANTEELSKEQRILRAMRKTLGNVVRDVTPLGGRPNPLTESTIQDIKDCFALISERERERELAEQLNFDEARPYFRDGSQPSAQVIDFVRPASGQDDEA